MAEVSLAGVRVLVVDDEVGVARAVARTLRRQGAQVNEAFAVDEARLRLGEGSYPLVLADIDLRGESGLDLLKPARIADPDTAFVVMTGKPELRSAVDAVNRGAHRYLLKPLTAEDIRSSAQSGVAAHRSSRLGVAA